MIGNRIKTLLHGSASKSVEGLALHCEVSVQAVYGWMRGLPPKQSRIDQIAKYLGVTPQDLQYGPVLSLSEAPRQNKRRILDLTMSEHAADLMISEALMDAKSVEFRLGMRDRLVFDLSGIRQVPMYQTGTCEADAYDAGNSYAETLLSKFKV